MAKPESNDEYDGTSRCPTSGPSTTSSANTVWKNDLNDTNKHNATPTVASQSSTARMNEAETEEESKHDQIEDEPKRKIELRNISKKERKALEFDVRMNVEKEIRAEMAPPKGGKPMTILHNGETLEVGHMIKLLHPWTRFVVTAQANSITFAAPPVPPPRPTTDKNKVEIFVGLTRASQTNRTYKTSRAHKILAGRPCFFACQRQKEYHHNRRPALLRLYRRVRRLYCRKEHLICARILRQTGPRPRRIGLRE